MSFEPPEIFNVADYFLDDRVREGRGGRIALRLENGELAYHEVRTLANRFAHLLAARGVRREERVLIALPDGAAYVAALFGTLKLGAVVVMLNPELSEAELAVLLDYSRAGAVVLDRAVEPQVRAAAAATTGFVGAIVVIDEDGLSLEELLAPHPESFENARTHRDDPAIWLFSGGTTGRPKAVVQTHRSFANTTELYAKGALGYREDDVTISVPKLFFGYATGSNLFFPFAVGASAVLFPEKPSPEVLFEKIRDFRPTILINVPTLVNRMVSHPEASAQDFSSLRFATSAGEALPVPLYERWKEIFGVELLDGLGTAEMWHIFVTNRPGEVKPGTLGKVVEGFELRVCDDDGREVPAGEVGRLWVRGGSRAIAYWQNLAKTMEALRGEWFVGGDLVSRDAEGWVTYCGRADDVLKVAGKWLVPAEVESCLLAHPGVKECAVVGAEDEQGLTKPYAFVIPREGAECAEEALKSFVLERLQPYKTPKRVILLETFPRTHLGKVDRGKLKGMVADQHGSGRC